MAINTQRIVLQIAEKVRSYAIEQGTEEQAGIPFCMGDLRKSIIVALSDENTAYIGSNLPYARAIHDGRPAITIKPKKSKVLAFWTSGDCKARRAPFPTGDEFKQAVKDKLIVVAKTVKLPEQKPRPFIRNAIERVKQEGLAFLAPEIKRGILEELEKSLR